MRPPDHILMEYCRGIAAARGDLMMCSLQDLFYQEKKAFSYGEVRRAWARVLADLSAPAQKRLQLYVHIPFCRRRCAYCMYQSDVLRDAAQLEESLGYLSSCFDYFSGTFAGREFQELYIGGGTPSILEERHLKTLLKRLQDRFCLASRARFTFEMKPADVTPGKARMLKAFGCNRVSLGVQTFNPRLLRAVNRTDQTQATVKRAIACLTRAGIEDVNCDLLLGLLGDTPDSLLAGVRKLLDMEPTTVILYYMQTQAQVRYFDAMASGDFAPFVASLEQAAAPDLRRLAESRGYRLERNAYAYCLDRAPRTVGTDPLRKVELGFGKYSNSSLNGSMEYQNRVKNFVFGDQDRPFAGTVYSLNDRIARFALNGYCALGHIPLSRIEAEFGVRGESYYRGSLRLLEKAGRIRREEGRVFLLAEDKRGLIADMLFLLDYGRLTAVRNFRKPDKLL